MCVCVWNKYQSKYISIHHCNFLTYITLCLRNKGISQFYMEAFFVYLCYTWLSTSEVGRVPLTTIV